LLHHDPAPLFAALGDETRLSLVGQLSGKGSLTLSELTAGSTVTRQAISKHLRVLEHAGLVRGSRRGRTALWTLFDPGIREARDLIQSISDQWGMALDRSKMFVGKDGPQRGGRVGGLHPQLAVH
jgi:DNA-binding transcriptional ArsR family regulator